MKRSRNRIMRDLGKGGAGKLTPPKRHLTPAEQAVFNAALRRSTTPIAKNGSQAGNE